MRRLSIATDGDVQYLVWHHKGNYCAAVSPKAPKRDQAVGGTRHMLVYIHTVMHIYIYISIYIYIHEQGFFALGVCNDAKWYLLKTWGVFCFGSIFWLGCIWEAGEALIAGTYTPPDWLASFFVTLESHQHRTVLSHEQR